MAPLLHRAAIITTYQNPLSRTNQVSCYQKKGEGCHRCQCHTVNKPQLKPAGNTETTRQPSLPCQVVNQGLE